MVLFQFLSVLRSVAGTIVMVDNYVMGLYWVVWVTYGMEVFAYTMLVISLLHGISSYCFVCSGHIGKKFGKVLP